MSDIKKVILAKIAADPKTGRHFHFDIHKVSNYVVGPGGECTLQEDVVIYFNYGSALEYLGSYKQCDWIVGLVRSHEHTVEGEVNWNNIKWFN